MDGLIIAQIIEELNLLGRGRVSFDQAAGARFPYRPRWQPLPSQTIIVRVPKVLMTGHLAPCTFA
jgi:hypothetical protein